MFKYKNNQAYTVASAPNVTGSVLREKSYFFWESAQGKIKSLLMSRIKFKLAELMYIEYFKNVIFYVTEEKIKRKKLLKVVFL